MKLFKQNNQSTCRVCGKKTADDNRYCFVCYASETNTNGRSRVIRVSMGEPIQPFRRSMFWVAALLLGIALIGAGYIAWNHFYTQPTVINTKNQAGDGTQNGTVKKDNLSGVKTPLNDTIKADQIDTKKTDKEKNLNNKTEPGKNSSTVKQPPSGAQGKNTDLNKDTKINPSSATSNNNTDKPVTTLDGTKPKTGEAPEPVNNDNKSSTPAEATDLQKNPETNTGTTGADQEHKNDLSQTNDSSNGSNDRLSFGRIAYLFVS